ncbi:MAG: putative S-layer associated protein [Deltaproteobacteria bacterium]|nr:putative S-layer associated protein [Deltaproteobacteria bacterium]
MASQIARWLGLALLASCVFARSAQPRPKPGGQPVDPYDPVAPEPKPAANTPEQKVLQLVNRYRQATGLPPVVLDAKLRQGCMEHAEYMRRNRGTEAMVGLNAHQQRPDLPGATAAGAACGKAADLFPGVSDLEAAVDAWMSGLYHRRPILTPSLARIAVGYAKLDDGSLMAALMFVDGDDPSAAGRWPVSYPSDNQTAIPLEFGNEIPNPVPGGARAGYPLTIQFPAFDKVTGVKARLTDAKGKPVAFFLSDPEHPATSFGQYGVVCLIPKRPLEPQRRYEVQVEATWKGKQGRWTWSFTTVTLTRVDAHDEAAVIHALNVPSMVRGKVVHGGMMDSETAFLQIGERTMKRYKMVSVLIPRAVWQELGGNPARFTGKTVEAEGTPHLVQGKYINVPITIAEQLRIVEP